MTALAALQNTRMSASFRYGVVLAHGPLAREAYNMAIANWLSQQWLEQHDSDNFSYYAYNWNSIQRSGNLSEESFCTLAQAAIAVASCRRLCFLAQPPSREDRYALVLALAVCGRAHRVFYPLAWYETLLRHACWEDGAAQSVWDLHEDATPGETTCLDSLHAPSSPAEFDFPWHSYAYCSPVQWNADGFWKMLEIHYDVQRNRAFHLGFQLGNPVTTRWWVQAAEPRQPVVPAERPHMRRQMPRRIDCDEQ